MISLKSLVPDRADASWPFQFDKKKLVAALRDLADKVEGEKASIQRVLTAGECHVEEFATSLLVIEFIEKIPGSDAGAIAAQGKEE